MTALEVADWRRRVFALYAEVREATDLFAAHDAWRRGRDALFATHPSSPLLPDDLAVFTGLPVTSYDPDWRFEVGISTALDHREGALDHREGALDHREGALDHREGALDHRGEPRRIEVETGTDGTVPFELIGVAEVPGVGSLDVWRLASYGGGIFVPVRDSLAGTAGGTYGGGRYLLDTVKGADLGEGRIPGSLVLDFNFAYNPSCAYDPAWACPLAQPGNTVDVEIPVGERYAG